MKKIILIGLLVSMACISSASAAIISDSFTNDLNISCEVDNEMIFKGVSAYLFADDFDLNSSPSPKDFGVDGLNGAHETASNENNQTNLSANADKNHTSSEAYNPTSFTNQDNNSTSIVVPKSSLTNNEFYYGILDANDNESNGSFILNNDSNTNFYKSINDAFDECWSFCNDLIQDVESNTQNDNKNIFTNDWVFWDESANSNIDSFSSNDAYVDRIEYDKDSDVIGLLLESHCDL